MTEKQVTDLRISPVAAEALGRLLCAGFGLDPQTVHKMTISLEAGKPTLIDVQFLGNPHMLGIVGESVNYLKKTYMLVERTNVSAGDGEHAGN